jgi:hypothetical protein
LQFPNTISNYLLTSPWMSLLGIIGVLIH